MLNSIATSADRATCCARSTFDVAGSNNIGTKPIAESGAFPGSTWSRAAREGVRLHRRRGRSAGIVYWVVLGRTRFGFDLRATGRSQSAAIASGVNVKRMVVDSRCCSPARSPAWSACRSCSGRHHAYSLDFPTGLGFTGIAIALLGPQQRRSAWPWARCCSRSSTRRRSSCDFNGISKEIVLIMQGTIVLSVVIVYELVRRYGVAAEQRRVSRELAASIPRRCGGDRMSTSTRPTPGRRHRPAAASASAAAADVGCRWLLSRSPAGPAADASSAVDHRRGRPHLVSGTVGAALALAVPIGMAGLGGLWSERAGVVNIGLEGMMILGTWGAGWAGYQWGPWTGVWSATVVGARRRAAARGRHGHLRRRPHRLRCRDQHPRRSASRSTCR